MFIDIYRSDSEHPVKDSDGTAMVVEQPSRE